MLLSLALAFLGGILLWASQPPRCARALQFLGFGCFFFALNGAQTSQYLPLWCGLLFSAGYLVPLLIQLRLHPIISGILLLSQTVVWTLLALGAAVLMRRDTMWGALASACLGAALSWLEWTALPLWGTAQSFARGWSASPRAVQFVAITGVTGAIWVILALAALGATAARHSELISQTGALILGLTMVLALVNWRLWTQKSIATMRVAAWGWAGQSFEGAMGLSSSFSEAVSRAAASGARLLVSPEAAFQVENRAAWRHSLQTQAARHKIALAVGYFDLQNNQNCIDFVDSNGEIVGRYVKTHLVPVFERYVRGTGELTKCEINGTFVGGLICQDDNFSDIAGNYGRAATQILAIPTHDWREVKDFHFVNACWRALELRTGLIKASSQGISAIVSPRGEIIEKCDHFESGAKLIVADIPIFSRKPTLFARGRDWFPILCGLLALLALLGAR